MTALILETTILPEVKVLTPRRFQDGRGHFSETWSQQSFRAAGVDFSFVQDNESLSSERGTLRGLHCQAPPFAQTKLVRVIAGSVLDVAVDVRKGSPMFGRWVAVELSAKNGQQLLIPRGFLHGFLTLTPNTIVQYKVDNPYAKDSEVGINWDDPDLAVDWGIRSDEVKLSDKDQNATAFNDWENSFVMERPA